MAGLGQRLGWSRAGTPVALALEAFDLGIEILLIVRIAASSAIAAAEALRIDPRHRGRWRIQVCRCVSAVTGPVRSRPVRRS